MGLANLSSNATAVLVRTQPRTGSTFHWTLLCLIMTLKLDCTVRCRIDNNMAVPIAPCEVVKTHHFNATAYSAMRGTELLVVASVAHEESDTQKYNALLGVPAHLPLQYVQVMPRLLDCPQCIIDEEMALWGLPTMTRHNVRDIMRWWSLKRVCCNGKESSLAAKQQLTRGRCPVAERQPAAESGLHCKAYNFAAVQALWQQNPLSSLIPPGNLVQGCQLTRKWVEEKMNASNFQCKDLEYGHHYDGE